MSSAASPLVAGFGALLALTGCSAMEFPYQLLSRTLGEEEASSTPYGRLRTGGEVEALPYAQIGVQLEGLRPAILVLTYNDASVESWRSSDDVELVTRSGRVISVAGLSPSFQVSVEEDPLETGFLRSSAAYLKTVTIDAGGGGDVVSIQMRCSMQAAGDPEPHAILDWRFLAQKYQETCENGEGRTLSEFWVSDEEHPYVWTSIQEPAPGLPSIRLDMLKRPAETEGAA